MKTALDHLETIVRGFYTHVGFVHGLTDEQYKALGEALEYIQLLKSAKDKPALALRLKENGHTIREIAELMGFKHPGSVSHLLNQAKAKKGKH